MSATPRAGTPAIASICVAVVFFGLAAFAYWHGGTTDWWSYSLWARRWIIFSGIVLVGLIVRILAPPKVR